MSLVLTATADAFKSDIEHRLVQFVNELSDPGELREAMTYALTAGGKRVRPLLAFGAAEACGQMGESLIHIGCALEMVHTYSLVHDDLPSMDNDSLRRGKPTLHIAYSEATAVLAGDALQAMAFEVLAISPTAAPIVLKCQRYLSEAIGARGMVAGQMQDVALVGNQTDLQSLQTMHSRKTGALIRASVLMGAATASRIDLMHLQALDQFSTNIGMAFQIRDDIIDCVSSTETLGKTSGSDAAADKPNYVSLLGLDGAQQQLQQHYQIARDSLDVFGDRCVTLRSLAEFIVQRMH